MSKPKPMRRRLGPEALALLEGAGVRWELRGGRKHDHLYIEGVFVQVIPHGGPGATRQTRNMLAFIRRHLRTT